MPKPIPKTPRCKVSINHLETYAKNADPNHYAILGVFGQFCLKTKPKRETSAIANRSISSNQK